MSEITKGFNTVVPQDYLPLFTWHELEVKVCGTPSINIQLMKKYTSYLGGYTKDHKVVLLFWDVLSSFSPQEQSLFLRFVCGRSRLQSETEWKENFQLRPLIVQFPRSNNYQELRGSQEGK